MAIDTWNFPCWQTADAGPNATPRNNIGMAWIVGPAHVTTQPFTNTITCIFSLLMRTGWTSMDGGAQGIFSIGQQGGASAAFHLQLTRSSTDPELTILAWDVPGGLQRYNIGLGDEDGTSWLSADKWYQFAISINPTGIVYAVNGSETAKAVETTKIPGNINVDNGNDRVWVHAPSAAWGVSEPSLINTNWPSVILGASAWSTAYLNLSSQSVRNRIWDSNGDFKNPGQNGSLWFGDAYGADVPEYYFLDGSPRFQRGSDTQLWANGGGGHGANDNAPGGLRKQYE